MSGQRHPDAEALARYKAALVAGFRARRLAAHVAGCARCASASDQLTDISTVLASVPDPAMPDAVERQIMAALTAEAAARQPASPATASPAGAYGSRAERRRDRRLTERRGPARRREWGIRPVTVFASAAACLLLAGFGYLLTQTGSSSSSSAASSAGTPAAGAVPSGAAAPGREPASKALSPTFGLKPMEGVSQAPFLVIATGTDYRQATLAAQVRARLAGNATPASSAGPPATAGSRPAGSSGGTPPSRSLAGCVSHLTGNVTPILVDRATYEGKPAYVIAVADRVWVVGLGCTASNPELITSVALPSSG